MQLMYDKGVANQTTADKMLEVLNKVGKSGEFLASTIRNISEISSFYGWDCQHYVQYDNAMKTMGRPNE